MRSNATIEWGVSGELVLSNLSISMHNNSFSFPFHILQRISTRHLCAGKILVNDCCCWMFHWPFAWLSPSYIFPAEAMASSVLVWMYHAVRWVFIPLLVSHIIILSDLIYIYWKIMSRMKRHKANKRFQGRFGSRKKGVKHRHKTAWVAIVFKYGFLIFCEAKIFRSSRKIKGKKNLLPRKSEKSTSKLQRRKSF